MDNRFDSSNPYGSPTPGPRGFDGEGSASELNFDRASYGSKDSGLDSDLGRRNTNSRLDRFLRANLHRSTEDKYVAGVLGGIAETYGLNSALVRALFLASFLIPGPQAILYFIMWFVTPKGY